ncbi:MAG: coiled-coil domain-containing protein, partial [Planctomycetota bacterium]
EDASDRAAGRLAVFAKAVRAGEIDIDDQQQVDEFIGGAGSGAVQGILREQIEGIQKGIKETEQAAVKQAVVNTLLAEAETALNDFIAKTKESADELAFAAARTNAAFANASADLNALSGGATSIQARQQATGVGQGKAGLDARQAFLERSGTQLGVDTSNIQGLDEAFTNIDDVAKEALAGLKNLGDGATVTADQVSSALVSGLEERVGKKLPKNLEQSIGSGIKAFSRQLGNGANIPVEELEQALEEGRLEEVLGPQAAAFQEQTNKVIEAMAQLEQSVAQLATLELESLTITRKNNAEEVKRLAANKKAIRDINKNLVGKATEAVDIVEEARNNVNNEAAALSGIGTSDPKELLAERSRAQSELDAFRRGEGTEGLSAVERATEEARLTNQVNATTDALKLLATDTTQLAAIQEKLNQALQQRQQLESGVTGILDTAFQGPGALNQFGFEAASLAGTGALSDQATDQFQFGQQSNAEIRQLINNLNDPRFAAAVDAQGRAAGEEGSRAERVRLQAVQQLGERFRSSQEFQDLDPAGQAIFEAELDGLLEVDKTIEQLSKEANDLLKIQNFILAEIAAQDGKNREAIIAQAREAVAANEQVVKNEIQKLNELAGTDETVQTTGQRAEQLAEKQLQVETALQLARQKQADLENQGFLGFGGASQEELDRNAAVIKSLEDDLGLIQENRRGVQGQAQARLDTAQTKLRDFEASIAAGTTGKTAEEEQRTLERLRGNVEQAQFTASSLDGPLASPTEIVDNSIQGQVTQGIQDAFAPENIRRYIWWLYKRF